MCHRPEHKVRRRKFDAAELALPMQLARIVALGCGQVAVNLIEEARRLVTGYRLPRSSPGGRWQSQPACQE